MTVQKPSILDTSINGENALVHTNGKIAILDLCIFKDLLALYLFQIPPIALDKAVNCHYNILVYRGMAKFGIALGSGPRGRGFESPYSDQKSGICTCRFRIFIEASQHDGSKFSSWLCIGLSEVI